MGRVSLDCCWEWSTVTVAVTTVTTVGLPYGWIHETAIREVELYVLSTLFI
jgi:hypothetical protein